MSTRSSLARRTIAGGTAVALIATLTACTTGSQGSTTPGKHLTFAYVSGEADPAYNTVGCGAKDAAKALGATVTQQDPTEFSPTAQSRTLNAVVARKPDGIIISPNDAAAMQAPIERAEAQGIKVTTALNTLNDASSLSSEVVNDEVAGGNAAADYLGKESKGRKVKVALITFKPKASLPADTRWHAFEKEIKKYPNITYLGPQFVADVSPSAATPVMNAILARHPDLWGVQVTFGLAGTGAVAAIRQRGKRLKVVTYDPGNPSTLKDLRSGDVSAVVAYKQRKLGAEALRQAYDAATGKPVKKKVVFAPLIYTAATTDQVIRANESPDC